MKYNEEKKFVLNYLKINFKPKYSYIISTYLDQYILSYDEKKHGNDVIRYVIKRVDNKYNEIINKEETFLLDMKKNIKKDIKEKYGNYIDINNLKKICNIIIDEIYEDYKFSYSDMPLHIFYTKNINKYIKDKDAFLFFYISIFSITDDIRLYFYERYSYIIEQTGIDSEVYKTFLYSILVDGKVNVSNFPKLLQDKINKYLFGENKKNDPYKNENEVLHYLEEIEKLENNSDADLEFIYNFNIGIVYEYVDKYLKSGRKSKWLLKTIIDAYDKCFNEYVSEIKNDNKKINLIAKIRNELDNVFVDDKNIIGGDVNEFH